LIINNRTRVNLLYFKDVNENREFSRMNQFIIRIKELWFDFFKQGQERSIKAKKNILYSFIIKGFSIVISLVFVPLVIDYVNPSRYGVWLTISSIVGWFSFFDIGLTQGLRNKFAEAKARGDDSLAQTYVSTTYVILGIIFLIVWLLFLAINSFLNWADILNVSQDLRSETSLLAIIVFSFFCIDFVLRIINTILTANQEPALSSLLDVLGQMLSLIIIIILVKTTQGSLIKLALALCASPLIILLIANTYFYRGRFEKYRPKISMVNFSSAKGLVNLGVVFFIIQLAGIIQFQTANVIIAQNFGTSQVTSYNIVYKYFGVTAMVNAIFLTPFWSASTEAFIKNDISWIKNSIKKYNILNLLLLAGGIIMLVLSEPVYDLWLGSGKVEIEFGLSLWGFLFFITLVFGAKYVFFLNSINALRIQFLSSLLSPFLYIAVAMVFIKLFNSGVSALFIASIFANFNGIILAPIQYYKIIYRNKTGIWIK